MAEPGFPANTFTDIIGPFMISSAFSMLFFGIVLTKAIEYCNRFWRHDGWAIKAAVITCLLGTLLDSVSVVGWAYLWTSTHWGDPMILATFPIYQQTQTIGAGVTTLATQLFFAWRIFVVQERSFLVSGVITILAVSQLAFVIWIAVNTRMFPSVMYSSLKPKMLHAWLGMNLVADVLITTALIWTLVIKVWRRGRSARVDRSPSLSTFRSIALRTFEFNIASLLVQIMLTWMTVRTSVLFWFELPASLIGKIYTLSVLVSLTARTETRFSNELNLSKYTVDEETPSKRRQLSSNTVKLDTIWSSSAEEQQSYVSSPVSPVAVYLKEG